MTGLIMAGTFALVQIVSFIAFIVVLVKLFRHEGALKGILGFFCGLYPFIWGWVKHRELHLTKIMAVWTATFVLSMALPAVMAATGARDLMMYAAAVQQNGSQAPVNVDLDQLKQKRTARQMRTKQASASDRPIVAQAKHNPQNGNWGQKALALWQNGSYSDPQKALHYWNEALKADSKSAEAYNNRGVALYNLKEHQRAIEDFNRAIQTKSDYAEAFNNRGNTYYELGNYQTALMDYNRSLDFNPGYAKARLNRGLAYYRMGETNQACSDFDQACKMGDCDGMQWAMKTEVCR